METDFLNLGDDLFLLLRSRSWQNTFPAIVISPRGLPPMNSGGNWNVWCSHRPADHSARQSFATNGHSALRQRSFDRLVQFRPAAVAATRLQLSGSANTQRTDPPSGAPISGVSVASDLISPEPLPVATATYCLPL